MGTCYICGKQGVDFKRNVFTGNSYRTTVNSNGNAYGSISAHFGNRIVCAKCALEIDYNKMKHKLSGISKVGILFLCATVVLCSLIVFSPKTFIPFATVSAMLGIIFLARGINDTKKNAVLWYAQNKNKYIDKIDIREADLMLEKSNKAIQKKNKQNEIQNQIVQAGLSIINRIKQEISLLETKANYINANYGVLNLNTITDCDKILSEIRKYEYEIMKTKDASLKQYDEYIKQSAYYSMDEDSINSIIEPVNAIVLNYTNHINQFLTELKKAENQILQTKISILEKSNS